MYVGCTDSDLCPVAALLSVSGRGPGAFVYVYIRPFLDYVKLVRTALARTDVDQRKYCGHSFRIGAATTAAVGGIEDSVIKTLGRWESAAYCRYVRLPREQLTRYAGILSTP